MKIDDRVLAELRPTIRPLDADWSHTTLARVMAAGPHAVIRGAGQRSKRRIAAIGVVVAASLVAGVGVASASGVMPQAFTDAFASWKSWPGKGADPADAERVATAPGPNGSVFTVMSTSDADGSSCRTAILETADSAEGPGPASFTQVYGDFCAEGPTFQTFGNAGVDYTVVAAYMVSAGEAVRAVVQTPSGQEYPALLVHGDFWGWFPKTAHPTLTGYAADGSVVGTVTLNSD